MGCGPRPGKVSQKLVAFSPENPTKNENFFSILTTRLAESGEGLNSSLAQPPGEL